MRIPFLKIRSSALNREAHINLYIYLLVVGLIIKSFALCWTYLLSGRMAIFECLNIYLKMFRSPQQKYNHFFFF